MKSIGGVKPLNTTVRNCIQNEFCMLRGHGWKCYPKGPCSQIGFLEGLLQSLYVRVPLRALKGFRV